MMFQSYFKWQKQMVLHTNSAGDDMEITLIWERPGHDGAKKKIEVGRTEVCLADASYFL